MWKSIDSVVFSVLTSLLFLTSLSSKNNSATASSSCPSDCIRGPGDSGAWRKWHELIEALQNANDKGKSSVILCGSSQFGSTFSMLGEGKIVTSDYPKIQSLECCGSRCRIYKRSFSQVSNTTTIKIDTNHFVLRGFIFSSSEVNPPVVVAGATGVVIDDCYFSLMRALPSALFIRPDANNTTISNSGFYRINSGIATLLVKSSTTIINSIFYGHQNYFIKVLDDASLKVDCTVFKWLYNWEPNEFESPIFGCRKLSNCIKECTCGRDMCSFSDGSSVVVTDSFLESRLRRRHSDECWIDERNAMIDEFVAAIMEREDCSAGALLRNVGGWENNLVGWLQLDWK